MKPLFASLICFLGIAYLLCIDRKRIDGVSNAVLIPLIWMFFAGSRFASQWLGSGPPADIYNDGSPLDRNVFLALIVAGVWVLARRKVDWHGLLVGNAWIWLLFLFAALSILWSDAPFLSFKRWIKGVGNLVMALIIVTERRPYEALGYVLRRLCFVLLPLSVLFVKYYPELGRQYHMGLPMHSGVTLTKNALGQLCLIVGVYFSWELLYKPWRVTGRRLHPSVYLICVPMIAWLLYMADSATSLACIVFALGMLLLLRLPPVVRKPRRIVGIAIALAVLLVGLNEILDLEAFAIGLLGRREDLTSRTEMWELALSMRGSLLLGTGYETFWTGSRAEKLWGHLGVAGIQQVHNGYIELYLNLGAIGLALLLISVVTGLRKAVGGSTVQYPYLPLRVTFVLTALLYNYTEATFVPVNNMFVLLLIGIIEGGFLRTQAPALSTEPNHPQSTALPLRALRAQTGTNECPTCKP